MKFWRFCGFLLVTAFCRAQQTGDIRLDYGSETTGVVQLFHTDSWMSVCAWSFSNTEATVACRQLGFVLGAALPPGAFGALTGISSYPEILSQCWTGQEASLTDCNFDGNAPCSTPGLEYASVHCYNDTPTPPVNSVRLDDEPPYFSSVSIYGSDMWGRVCTMFWDDNDANVICRQFGYHGGIAAFKAGETSIPFLLSQVNCVGNETSLFQCPIKTQVCENDRSAAVVCYGSKDPGPTFSLVGGHNSNHGKVVFSIDGRQGLVCKSDMTWKEAYALCKTMGFTSGSVLNMELETPDIDSVALEGITCQGTEESVYECTIPSWNDTTAQCQGQQMGLVLNCYNKVRLVNALAVEEEEYHMGRPEIFDDGRWYAVCGDTFDKTAATVTCRELGYPVAVLLTPDSFSNRFASTHVSNLACTGTETRLADCPYSLGGCETYSQHAALLCTQPNTDGNTTMIFSDSYYGAIEVTMFGVEGTVCMEGWDDAEATMACKSAGFSAGVVLAGGKQFLRYKPVWAFNFECMGHEMSLEECTYETEFRTTDWTCAEDLTPAGVLCFNNPPPDPLVRIKDGFNDAEGRIEVYSETTGWGTICNSGWSVSDAQVVCKQLGYADGQNHGSGFSQADNDVPVVLANVQCDGTEHTLYECANSGWTKISSSCSSHTKDAGVYCYRHVTLENVLYGAVQYHDGDAYGLVCADGFDQNAADVVCKETGNYFGKPLCCSAMGPNDLKVTMYDLKCSGSESSLQECMFSTENPVCQSGQYASAVCSQYDIGHTDTVVTPLVKMTYFLHEGYVCTEDFTDKDATVLCRQGGYSYGYAYKASATGPEQDARLEKKIRWLRGLYCEGTETSFLQCGSPDWGQIGVCNWDAVAATLCSNNPADMDFNVRLADGTSTVGRLEVYIKSTWGTVCGTHLTKSEAVVVCRELGYHDGITMAPGHYGAGTGQILLSGIKCVGNESSVRNCIWSGYTQTSQVCDHTKDAAIKCYSNVRLTGSTTINYGRLEVFDEAENDWMAVCDRNQNVNNANLLCRQLGYVAGMFQRGSPLGPTTLKISIVDMTCSTQDDCTFSRGECPTGEYIALYCSESIIVQETVIVRLPLNSFYGPVEINRFGLWGHICSVGFDDDDAAVICSELRYNSGTALKTFKTEGYPIIQGNVKCTGTEAKVADCDRPTFADGHDCFGAATVAAVICYDEDGVTLESTPLNHELGQMKSYVAVIANGKSLRVDMTQFDRVDAAVYCSSLDYAGGEELRQGYGNYGVSELSCTRMEESILECSAVWDSSKTQSLQGDLAGVICYTSVRLQGGDPARYGAVITSKGVNSGPVCADGFDEVDAGVACRNLGHEAGLVLCCSPFGSLEDPGIMTNIQCAGNEKQFTDCVHDDINQGHAEACKKDYAAVACYSGLKPTDYTLSIGGSSLYTGTLVLRYLDIDGSVCIDGWDDNDAHVACRELGFNRGMAYRATRSDSPAPFWTSQIQCDGPEGSLAECDMTEFGQVTKCSNTLSHAGVICFNNDGMYYRLGGSGESRYGRVEVSLNGEWRSLCNLYWENEDTHVLCKMLGFRTGEAYRGVLRDVFRGPVWEANFLCDGTEATLNQCVSSGWRVSTVPACALHENDAAAFCYRSVKLSTGVGRETDQGAVLFYYNNRWYTICNKGFTDKSAQVVCRELGFIDGQVQRGSSYGSLTDYPRLTSHTVKCGGDETDMTDCLVEEACDAQDYVSVVCYGFTLTTTAAAPPKDDSFNATPIIVAVVLFVALVVVGIVVLYCLSRRRKLRKLERSKETFDNTILSENVDGSVQVSNRLHGMVDTPELSRAHFTNRNGTEDINLERSYDNPVYRRGDGEYAQPTNNRTVIQVDSNPYDRIMQSGDRLGDSHQYDNLHESQLEKERATDKVNEDVVEKDDNAGPDLFISPFAAQGVLHSPTDTHSEPSWNQDDR